MTQRPTNKKSFSSKPILGIAFMAFAIFMFNAVNVIVKDQADAFPIGQILFFRNLFALIPATLILIGSQGLKGFGLQQPKEHLKRALFGSTGLLCIFLSVKLLNLAEVAAIFFTTSLFMTALSPLILKEHVGWHRWAAIIVGFLAILWMKPPSNLLQIGVIIALAGSLLDSINMLYSRKITRTEHSATTHFYFTLFGLIFSSPLIFYDSSMSNDWTAMIFGWKPLTQNFINLMLILGIGGGIAKFCVTLANQHATPSVVAPVIYTAIIWAIIFDYFIWNVAPTTKLITGSVIVIACGLYITWRERKLSLRS